MTQTIRLMVKEEGFSSLWKGHIAAQLLSVTFGAVQFSTYELLYDFGGRYKRYDSSWTDAVLSSCCGTVAGLAATVVSFPLDVVRTHLIYQGEPKVSQSKAHMLFEVFCTLSIKCIFLGI